MVGNPNHPLAPKLEEFEDEVDSTVLCTRIAMERSPRTRTNRPQPKPKPEPKDNSGQNPRRHRRLCRKRFRKTQNRNERTDKATQTEAQLNHSSSGQRPKSHGEQTGNDPGGRARTTANEQARQPKPKPDSTTAAQAKGPKATESKRETVLAATNKNRSGGGNKYQGEGEKAC